MGHGWEKEAEEAEWRPWLTVCFELFRGLGGWISLPSFQSSQGFFLRSGILESTTEDDKHDVDANER